MFWRNVSILIGSLLDQLVAFNSNLLEDVAKFRFSFFPYRTNSTAVSKK